MFKKDSWISKLSICLAIVVVLCLIVFIPDARELAMTAMIELLDSIPFAGFLGELFIATVEGSSLDGFNYNLTDSIWADILKSLAIILLFYLIEKLLTKTIKSKIYRILALFASFFACSVIISFVTDQGIAALIEGDTPVAATVITVMVIFFAVAAVLVRWVYGGSLVSSIFYVIFKFLFGLVGIGLTSAFALTIYATVNYQNLSYLIVAAVFVAVFGGIKFAEYLILDKRVSSKK